METCGCEHIDHFTEDDIHEYLGVKVEDNNLTKPYIGPICNACNERCYKNMGVWA